METSTYHTGAGDESDVAAPPAASQVEMTVAVYAAKDQPTAEVVCGALNTEGIPAVVGEQVADAFESALAVAEGYYAEVRVPPAFEQQARELIAAYEQGGGDVSVSDEALTAQALAASDPRV